NGRGEATPDWRVTLARYGDRAVLQAATPVAEDWPHRITLLVPKAPGRQERTSDWTGRRFLWDAREAHRLPQWDQAPDLALLASRLIEPRELHPLVRAALLPDQPDPGYHPRVGRPAD